MHFCHQRYSPSSMAPITHNLKHNLNNDNNYKISHWKMCPNCLSDNLLITDSDTFAGKILSLALSSVANCLVNHLLVC